jgi:hypothetical protein
MKVSLSPGAELKGIGPQIDNAPSLIEAHSHAKPGSTFAEGLVLAEFSAQGDSAMPAAAGRPDPGYLLKY